MQVSLSGKFNLVTGVLTVFTTVAMGGLLIYDASDEKNRALLRRGVEVAEMIAESGRRAVYSGDGEAARDLLVGLAAGGLCRSASQIRDRPRGATRTWRTTPSGYPRLGRWCPS